VVGARYGALPAGDDAAEGTDGVVVDAASTTSEPTGIVRTRRRRLRALGHDGPGRHRSIPDGHGFPPGRSVATTIRVALLYKPGA